MVPRVSPWGVLVIGGMALAIAVAVRRGRARGLSADDVVLTGLIACASGLAGAWLLGALVHRDLTEGGFVFYGGFLVAVAASLAWLRAWRIPIGPMADAAAVALPLGHAVGRVGCFFAGCCYGRTLDGGARIPVQLIEAAGLVVIAIITSRSRAPFLLYVALYACLRLGTEALRGDFIERGAVGPLAPSQFVALLALLATAWLHVRQKGLPA
jgi:phosphatidylglycerol:prolipoprotein diacylglycerol transferase